MSAYARLIARVLAGAWRAAPPPPDFTAGDLEAAAPLLHKSGAGALAWWRIRGTPLAQTPTGAGFRHAYRLHALEADVHGIKTAGVLQRLDAAGVEALVVKGWAIARHYPEVGLRQYTDLDVVVRPGEMGRRGSLLPVLAIPGGRRRPPRSGDRPGAAERDHIVDGPVNRVPSACGSALAPVRILGRDQPVAGSTALNRRSP